MNVPLNKFPQYWKAAIGFVAPAATVIGWSVLPNSDGGSHVTQAEWILAAVSAVVTSAGVAAKGNAPKDGA